MIDLSNYEVFDLCKNCVDCQRVVNCYGIDINVADYTNYITIDKFGRIMGYVDYPTIDTNGWINKGGCNTLFKRAIVHLGSIRVDGEFIGWENSRVRLEK